MTPSLCAVLPVRDAQANLADTAAGLLEMLPELSADFELLVIDNGSTDATPDAADDLQSRYPQVRVVRHGTAVEVPGIVRTVLAQSSAELILLCDEDCRLELKDLHKLWRSRGDYDAVLAWPAGAGAVDEEACGKRVRAWRLRLAPPINSSGARTEPGYQLLHRRVLEKLRWTSRDRYELLAELSRYGLRWQVVEVRPARSAMAQAAERLGPSRRVDERSTSVAGPAGSRLPQPLEKLKAFALGE